MKIAKIVKAEKDKAMIFFQQFLPDIVAIASTTIALVLKLWLEPFLLKSTVNGVFYLAIIVTSCYSGWRLGLIAVVLSTLAINYFLTSPQYQLGIATPETLFQLTIFFLIAFLINLLTSHLRDSKQQIEQLNKQLAEEKINLLRTAPLAAQMGMWNWNIETGKIEWSRDHEELFGLTPGTFDGRYESFLVCLHPDDKESINQALQEAIANKSLYQVEYRVVWPDGSIHWIEARGHAFYNQAGEPIQMTGTATAIDRRKQAQGLLQEKFEAQRLSMEITQRIRQSLNLEEIFQTTVNEIRQLLQTDRVIIFQFDPKWRGTVVAESVGTQWTAILSTEIYDPCFGEQYVEPYKQGLVTVKSDIYNAGIDICHLQLLANFQVRANLVVPIVKGGELWGLLIAHNCARPRQWQSTEIDLMRQLANQVSIAIQQSELFEQVQTELTERKQAEMALKQLNAELEQRVAKRTLELSQLNDRLLEVLLALQESEERRRLALDLTHIGFWDFHIPSGKVIWNDNHFTLLGLNPNTTDPSFELWRSCVHPEDLNWVEKQFLESIANCTDFAAEYRIVHPDGSVHWLMGRAKAISDAEGKPVRSLGVLLDICDRKQIEEALRQSEAKFRSLSEYSPLGVFKTNIHGDYVYINPRYQAICGCTFDEALGKGWLQFIHPEDREKFKAAFAKVRAQKQEFFGEMRFVRKDGTIRFARVRSAPIVSATNNLIGYVGMVEDITDNRAIEVMKKEFISIVSHELRTPLAAIRGSLGLLASGVLKNKPETAQQMLDIAVHDTERLVRLVNDILDLERLEAQKVKLNKQWYDGLMLMQQSVETVQSLAIQSNIRLVVEPTSVLVWGDSDRIIQTLVNLISNAIKFSPPETTVTLSVKDQTNQVLFEVKDQGRGIPADKLETIFGRFQQVDASDSREKGGTGLGLAICKSIVQQHRGKIWVESYLGEGSSFYFTLPKNLD
ncbi:PAS domain-containing protein [Aerosakkonemataceae cyanobacterium BLCC-F154]|uniref:histidine kinase n=1 Tax=Floridaenema fluviatile BLCC-F154 TaxID=3153640 RepID=A0ABV4YF40_9CYAN